MLPITWLWIALSSIGLLGAAERPRYGGELRVQLRATLRQLDVTVRPADPAEAAVQDKLLSQVFETLVEMDERGRVRPGLAVSWSHDAGRKRWVFVPRSHATWHDGRPVERFEFSDDRPVEQLMKELASPARAVVRTADGVLLGTGPFRIAEFEPNRRLKLVAHAGHWGGRPFLDAVEVGLARGLREQALAFDVGSADVVEIAWNETRRTRQRAGRAVQSALNETLALVFDSAKVQANARQAVAASIDRASLHAVLLQKQGEPSGALLPQWLSGWAFTFGAVRDVAKARRLAGNANFSFSYDKADPLMRAIGDRIVLNAGEASIALKPPTGAADVRLGVIRVNGLDPLTALKEAATLLRVPAQEDAYALERLLVEDGRIVPLVHLPATYMVAARVKNWQGAWVRTDEWKLSDVWLDKAP